MNIPFSCNYVTFIFDIDGTEYEVSLLADQNNYVKERELSYNSYNIYGNIKKWVIGYHYDFDLKLIDDTLKSPLGGRSQQNLLKFFYYYRANTNIDKSFKIRIGYNYGSMIDQNDLTFNVVLSEDWTLENLQSGSLAFGSILNLKLTTTNYKTRQSIVNNPDVTYMLSSIGYHYYYPNELTGFITGISIGSQPFTVGTV